ncbi:MAG: histidine kinase [Pseudomonadota bacterium]
MPLTSVRSRAPVETVIPDCCNIGVIFRTLIAVNGAVFATSLLRAPSVSSGVVSFIEVSILVELACLYSLLALCGSRRLISPMPAWAQRATCALVPAVVTALVIRFLSTLELFHDNVTSSTMVAGVVSAAFFGISLQHYFELRTRAFSPALAEARLQALQARIRPHFFFNSLNAVLSLIRTEPRQAETALEDLADLFRILIRDARHMTSLEDEIHVCKQYLSIEKIRLGDRFEIQWEMANISDDILRKAQIPALLLQPLLENAVHHGVEPASAPVLIQIRVGRSIDRIEIAVLNPYHGETNSRGNQMALDNIRERLALLFDVEGNLTHTISSGIFEVRLRFPYVKAGR